MRLIAAILTIVTLTLTGIGTAQAAAPSSVVIPKKATLLADGSVRVKFQVRCSAHQQAFEWSIGIRQNTAFGGDGAGPAAGLIVCDGTFHTVHAAVVASTGAFGPGRADVTAAVQLFDTQTGSDVEIADQRVVRLSSRPCAKGQR